MDDERFLEVLKLSLDHKKLMEEVNNEPESCGDGICDSCGKEAPLFEIDENKLCKECIVGVTTGIQEERKLGSIYTELDIDTVRDFVKQYNPEHYNDRFGVIETTSLSMLSTGGSSMADFNRNNQDQNNHNVFIPVNINGKEYNVKVIKLDIMDGKLYYVKFDGKDIR